MRHGYKKVKFGQGIDANEMLLRKLASNFFIHGKIVTTQTKAKRLKQYIEQLVEKTKERTESNKNYLLRKLGSDKLVDTLYENVSDKVRSMNGGYVRVQKLAIRVSDGAPTARVQWSFPMVMEDTKKVAQKKQSSEKAQEPKVKK